MKALKGASMVALIVALFFTPYWTVAQCYQIGCRSFAQSAGGSNTWTLDPAVTPCNEGNPGGTTVSCNLTSVTAGDFITAQAVDGHCLFLNVTDNVNGGNYSVVYSNQSDANDPNCTSQLYFKNSASGNLTITATFSGGTGSQQAISAQAWKDSGGGTAPSLDSTFSSSGSPFFQVNAGSSTVNCGTAKTPSANNELVIAFVEGDVASYSNGTGYTPLTINTTNNPGALQYQIQTTATSTNGPFNVTAPDDWGAGCAAFKP